MSTATTKRATFSEPIRPTRPIRRIGLIRPILPRAAASSTSPGALRRAGPASMTPKATSFAYDPGGNLKSDGSPVSNFGFSRVIASVGPVEAWFGAARDNSHRLAKDAGYAAAQGTSGTSERAARMSESGYS